jgi:hypothetical protein
MGREGVAEGVARRGLGDPGRAHRIPHGALEDGFVQVVTAPLAGGVVDIDAGGREDPLPAPLASRVRILAKQRAWQLHPAGAVTEIGLMLLLDTREVRGERALDRGGRIVARSFRPLPSRMRIWFVAKSTSLSTGDSIREGASLSRRAGWP